MASTPLTQNPPTTPADKSGVLVHVPQAANIEQLRAVEVGESVAAPRAAAAGAIDVEPGTPVVVVAQGLLKNRTVRIALALIGGAFSFFLGFVADQIIAWGVGRNLPWWLDTLVVLVVGSAGICLALFWKTPVLSRVRKAIIAGLTAFFGYVAWTIYNNNGLDGIDWKKTEHAALNAAIIAALGGIFILTKLVDNNPVARGLTPKRDS